MSEIDRAKIARCKAALRDSYLDLSVVGRAVDGVDFNHEIHENQNFLTLGKWIYIPKEWFTDPSIYPDAAFSDIGRGISIGEEKHIIDTILSNRTLQKIDYTSGTFAPIEQQIRELTELIDIRENVTIPNFIMFAPIEYFTQAYIDWTRDNPNLRLTPGGTDFTVRFETTVNGFEAVSLTPFWSSKYVPSSDFILFQKSACRWIAKPNIYNRLEVHVVESSVSEKMELKAFTIFKFEIAYPERIRILSPREFLVVGE